MKTDLVEQILDEILSTGSFPYFILDYNEEEEHTLLLSSSCGLACLRFTYSKVEIPK